MNIPASSPKPRRRRRWLKRIVIAILILPFLAITAIGIEWKWTRVAGQRKLNAITARLDAEDPGWRFDDIVAAHNAKVPPDAENSALKAVEIVKGFTGDTGAVLHILPPNNSIRLLNETLAGDQWDILEGMYPDWEPGIVALRTWDANTPRAAFKIEYAGKDRNPFDIRLGNILLIRDAVKVLVWDAIHLAHAGHGDSAIASSIAGLHLVRSVEHEPSAICYLVRIATAMNSMQSTEQSLAWCSNANDPALMEMQELVLKDSSSLSFRAFVRGERAMMHRMLEFIDLGGDTPKADKSMEQWWSSMYDRRNIFENSAILLEVFKNWLEILDLPSNQCVQAARQWQPPQSQTLNNKTAMMLLPAVGKLTLAGIRYHAKCLCTAAGIACERYRLKHHRWPTSLDDLVEFGIPKGLVDPFDGQPLRFQPTEDGIVVYSIGSDGIDNGGEIVTRSGMPRDVGFRLWNVESRRIPPPPPPMEEIEKD